MPKVVACLTYGAEVLSKHSLNIANVSIQTKRLEN